jgi:hypothetical protein
MWFCIVICISLSGCVARQPRLSLQTPSYVVIESSPERFVVLTKSKAAMDEISRQLGCDRRHVCAGVWSGEMRTIERLK